MIKITDGEKTICAGPYLNEDGIAAAKTFLYEQINKIDKYPDKSLFFQNPLIIEGWIDMVRTLQEVKKWEVPEDDEQWAECAEMYVAYLFELRAICNMYKDLYRAYHKQLWGLLEFYGGWLEGEYISYDGMETMCSEKYEKDLKDVDDMPQYVAKLNKESHESRFATFTILSDAYDLLMAIMNRGGKIVIALNPTEADFARAFDADLRIRTRSLKGKMFREMEEELARYYMENRTDGYTRKMWSKMQVADEEALKMANNKQLTKCDDSKQEHWGKAMKAKMERNGKLMGKILSLIKFNELFDLGKPENVKPLIELLGPENLSLFYDIIIRRSLIQCEMFSELKTQHEAWLNDVNEQPKDVDDTSWDSARQSKQDDTAPNDVKDDKNEEDETELVTKLKPIFYNNEENVRRFLKEIRGMATEDITDLVNRWVNDKLISDYGNSRKGVLWGILHDAKLYSRTKTNWNGRVT